jgi:hypothetical protein
MSAAAETWTPQDNGGSSKTGVSTHSTALDARPTRVPSETALATATVNNCDDDGPGSLRAAVATNAAIIDMTALACSTITLATGEIFATVASVTFNGPTNHALTIDANHDQRVLVHNGAGTLTLDHVNLTNGSVGGGDLLGGCVLAYGNMKLQNATISNCTLTGGSVAAAEGGAVFVFHDLTLNDSVLSGSVAQATGSARAYGGGAFVGGKLVMNRSAIRDNTESASAGSAGGAYVGGDAQLYAATISGNIAALDGGLVVVGNATINNSTISTNSSSLVGGVYAIGSLVLDNSTVALNSHTSIKFGAGIYAKAGMIAHSSIVANNMCTTSGQHCEVQCNSCLVTGSNNLIMGANGALPPGTIVVDPVLGPLADNGGSTRTHALLSGSPAIDNGSNIHDFPLDQRGYSRNLGNAPDIGAFESGSDVIFADGFD